MLSFWDVVIFCPRSSSSDSHTVSASMTSFWVDAEADATVQLVKHFSCHSKEVSVQELLFWVTEPTLAVWIPSTLFFIHHLFWQCIWCYFLGLAQEDDASILNPAAYCTYLNGWKNWRCLGSDLDGPNYTPINSNACVVFSLSGINCPPV